MFSSTLSHNTHSHIIWLFAYNPINADDPLTSLGKIMDWLTTCLHPFFPKKVFAITIYEFNIYLFFKKKGKVVIGEGC